MCPLREIAHVKLYIQEVMYNQSVLFQLWQYYHESIYVFILMGYYYIIT